jgi:hypothetical protein
MLQFFAHEIYHLCQDVTIDREIMESLKILRKPRNQPGSVSTRVDCLQQLGVGRVVFDSVKYDLRKLWAFTLPHAAVQTFDK